MNSTRIPLWVRKLLDRSVGHRYYPAVVALIAFASTASFSFPFVIVLIPAVLLAPRRWFLLGVLTGVASGIGGAVLVELFQYLGKELVLERYPQLVDNAHWQSASAWLHAYGLFALAVIAGSPIPQTPAIFAYSLAEPSTLGVLVAIGIGKTVKYVFLSWVIARYPSRFIRYRQACNE
ncbi:YqaA family protein [Propionivibrio dicarboxylicus]|uniref:Membrane protein YqaA, SNARE-associated domain n=1 Tax=Propionivibrio dicarboxylicus TaxID=83767 RepID=A0A1G7VRQ5_9RHOO|nr:hypothetical protein [Propionivibrio dicarboxylicus]SDG62444.1 membrane protein YqaA, SNARE-associated domain [Propionivibrio dicarboxylicus]